MADNSFKPLPYRVKDLRGVLFGRLTPIRYLFTNENRQAVWECQCSCPAKTLKNVSTPNLEKGTTKSCGCLYKESRKTICRTHGGYYEPEYGNWRGMMKRCYNPRHVSYPEYGAKGIIVCARWHDYNLFKLDMGPRPSPEHSLDRYPNREGNYEPGNVRWATRQEQQNNLKSNVHLTLNGETLTQAGWTHKLKWHPSKIKNRRRAGWSDERTLTTP